MRAEIISVLDDLELGRESDDWLESLIAVMPVSWDKGWQAVRSEASGWIYGRHTPRDKAYADKNVEQLVLRGDIDQKPKRFTFDFEPGQLPSYCEIVEHAKANGGYKFGQFVSTEYEQFGELAIISYVALVRGQRHAAERVIRAGVELWEKSRDEIAWLRPHAAVAVEPTT